MYRWIGSLISHFFISQKLQRKIDYLEKQEVDLDDSSDEQNSAYIQVCRYVSIGISRLILLLSLMIGNKIKRGYPNEKVFYGSSLLHFNSTWFE